MEIWTLNVDLKFADQIVAIKRQREAVEYKTMYFKEPIRVVYIYSCPNFLPLPPFFHFSLSRLG